MQRGFLVTHYMRNESVACACERVQKDGRQDNVLQIEPASIVQTMYAHHTLSCYSNEYQGT